MPQPSVKRTSSGEPYEGVSKSVDVGGVRVIWRCGVRRAAAAVVDACVLSARTQAHATKQATKRAHTPPGRGRASRARVRARQAQLPTARAARTGASSPTLCGSCRCWRSLLLLGPMGIRRALHPPPAQTPPSCCVVGGGWCGGICWGRMDGYLWKERVCASDYY
jgi:hypothetical protein